MNRCSRITRRRPDFPRRSRYGEFIQIIAKQVPAADIVHATLTSQSGQSDAALCNLGIDSLSQIL